MTVPFELACFFKHIFPNRSVLPIWPIDVLHRLILSCEAIVFLDLLRYHSQGGRLYAELIVR
jgi:hypothetical protein